MDTDVPSILRFVDAADGTRIAWHTSITRAAGPMVQEEESDPSRRAIVLTNGLSTTANFWSPLRRALSPEHRVVHWSYRGHGESESARSGEYAIATHADDLARVSDAVRARDPRGPAPVQVAFSMGVTVLLELVRRRPELASALVLIAGGADHPHASSAFFRIPGARRAVTRALGAIAPIVPGASPIARRVAASRALFPIARAAGAIGPDAPREEVETFFRTVGAMDLRAYWESLRSLMAAHASDVLEGIRVPVLVIAPERDMLASRADVEALRRAIPGAEWMLVPRTSHAMLLEAGDVIGARIRAFVAAIDSRSRPA